MTSSPDAARTAAGGYDATAKQKAADKTSRISIKVVPAGDVLKKPDWIRVNDILLYVQTRKENDDDNDSPSNFRLSR